MLIYFVSLSPPFTLMDSSPPHGHAHDPHHIPVTPSSLSLDTSPSVQPTQTHVITSQTPPIPSHPVTPQVPPAHSHTITSQAPPTPAHISPSTASTVHPTPHSSSSTSTKRCFSTPRQSKGSKCAVAKKPKASSASSKREFKKCCKQMILSVDHQNILEKFRYLNLTPSEKTAVDQGLRN